MISDKKVYWVLLLYLLFGLHLYAQRTITEIGIDISGLGAVNEKYVRNNMRTKKGDEYYPSRVNEDVVTLMKTGRFESVTVVEGNVGVDGVKLTLKVRAFPLVTEVELFLFRRRLSPDEDEINNPVRSDLVDAKYLRIKKSKLLKDIKMDKGQQFNTARMHTDEKSLEEAYLKKGYYPVIVEGQRVGGSVRYIISEGENFRIERGEMIFESTASEPLSFKHKQLKKEVKTRQRRVWYSPISWFVDDGKLKPQMYREDKESLETFYRDQGYLDVQVSISHGADKVLTSPEYATLREKLFQSRIAHSKAVEDLAEADRAMANLPEEGNLDELERLVDAAESRLDDAEDVLDDAEDAFEDYMDDNDRVPFVFSITEGPQYKVGGIKIEYGRVVNNKFQEVTVEQLPEFKPVIPPEVLKSIISSVEGEVFHPNYLRVGEDEDSDQEIIDSAYGNRAYIDAKVFVVQVPNLKDNVMDIVFQVREGNHFFEDNGELKWERRPINVGLVKIEGNAKTKDFVIRRELSISPGEPFDLGKMHNSRRRINGLRLFAPLTKLSVSPEYSDRERGSTIENLVIGVRETNTGRFQIGGGFSTDSGAFAHVILSQQNFDIMRWRRPYFWQGAGQKVTLRTVAGGRYSNYVLDFEEPWFRGRKLKFKTSIYTRESRFYSDKFDVEETGIRLGLEKAVFGDESFRGKMRYTIEDIGLVDMENTASTELLAEQGNSLISVISPGLVYDTRGDGFLPSKGQRSSIDLEYAPGELGSEKEFYGLHLKSAWYFKGLGKGHVLEFLSQVKSYESLEEGQPVPYLYRPYLGGSRSLRAYPYREVGPRGSAGDYIGGNTMMHATMEYSVPTPFKIMRFATFYDVGVVNSDSYDFNTSGYNDDYGFGVRLEIPLLGPIRLDYAIPLTDDGNNGGGGRFSVNMGYTTTF